MSISYSGITNYGKVTLPSVETWGRNMNILVDPPKTVTTRRIDKVSQTSLITEMIDDSENRAAEVILKYARGVNPSVSVSYSNNSNNGGQNTSGGIFHNGVSASLPYKLDAEAFRPPIQTQFSLLPLSRMPRIWTTSYTQPGFADFSKKLRTPTTAEETREVKNELLKGSIHPTALYKVDKPLDSAPSEVKHMVQEVLSKNYTTVPKGTDITMLDVLEPNRQINHDFQHHEAYTNPNSDYYITGNNEIYTDKYIQDSNAHQVFTNVGSDRMQITRLDEIEEFNNIQTKDLRHAYANTNVTGYNKNEYFHDDQELERNLPTYEIPAHYKGNSSRVDHIYEDYELERNIPSYEIPAHYKGDSNIVNHIYEDYELERNLPTYEIPAHYKGDSNIVNHIYEDYELERNLPYYDIPAHYKGDSSRVDHIYNPVELERNLPTYEIPEHYKGDSSRVDYMHNPIELERNIPTYEIPEHYKGDFSRVEYMHNPIELERNLPNYELYSNQGGDHQEVSYIHDPIELERNLPNYELYSNQGGDHQEVSYIHDPIELERNLPKYELYSNQGGDHQEVSYIHDPIELERNLPNYELYSNQGGDHQEVSYIHDPIELERNLPEHTAHTNIKHTKFQQVEHDKDLELERNIPLTNMYVNKSTKGDVNNNSRDYQINDAKYLSKGEFNIPAQIPMIGRSQKIKDKYDNSKPKRSKLGSNQFGRK